MPPPPHIARVPPPQPPAPLSHRSKSDPMAVLYLQEQHGLAWSEVGRTDVVANNLSEQRWRGLACWPDDGCGLVQSSLALCALRLVAGVVQRVAAGWPACMLAHAPLHGAALRLACMPP